MKTDTKIGVFTYNQPHRKTQDLICKLKMKGYTDITLIVFQWEERKHNIPLYKHRPTNTVDIPVVDLCKRMDLKYIAFNESDLDTYDKLLIGGAGILNKSLVEKYEIINSHPGYLPNVRGLDALKWAIYNGQPIGVTTHVTGAGADTGLLIDRKIVLIAWTDSFYAVAMRQYEMEIDMLVDAVEQPITDEELEALIGYPVHKRMNCYDEVIMMKRFTKMTDNL